MNLPALAEALGADAVGLESEAGMSRLEALPGFGGATCVIQGMSCNQTVAGNLSTSDCDLGGGFYTDFWSFSGTSGQTVTINLASASFDTFLALLNPVPEVVASDDDGGPGTNSRIMFTLNQTGNWTIAPQNFFANDLGSYTLSLDCTGGTGGVPAAPSNLTATAVSTTEIDIFWNDNSNNEDEFRVELRPPGGSFQDIGAVGANSAGASISNLSPGTEYDFRVRARNSNGNSSYSNTATATTFGSGGGACVPDADTLCLQGDRFRVEVDWERSNGSTGVGTAVELTPDTGYFWFFNAANVEMVVKVLDNCNGFTNRFWVFAGGLTNVEVQMTVTDTQTGTVRNYFNPQSTPFQPIQDTDAFATCP